MSNNIKVFGSNVGFVCDAYAQFHGWAEFTTNTGRHVWAKVSDESCGDFGYRWVVTFYDRKFGRQEVEPNDKENRPWFEGAQYAITYCAPSTVPVHNAYGTLCRTRLKELNPDDYDPIAVAWDLWEAVGNAAEESEWEDVDIQF